MPKSKSLFVHLNKVFMKVDFCLPVDNRPLLLNARSSSLFSKTACFLSGDAKQQSGRLYFFLTSKEPNSCWFWMGGFPMGQRFERRKRARTGKKGKRHQFPQRTTREKWESREGTNDLGKMTTLLLSPIDSRPSFSPLICDWAGNILHFARTTIYKNTLASGAK